MELGVRMNISACRLRTKNWTWRSCTIIARLVLFDEEVVFVKSNVVDPQPGGQFQWQGCYSKYFVQ